MTDVSEPGRRERKKAATRQAIADAAMEMFLEHGFDAVTIKQIADRADVSLATVYAHFPQKEALVFDEDDARRDALLDAVRRRPAGMTISAALHGALRSLMEEALQYAGQQAAFQELIATTPALQAYERAMWLRHESALAETVADAIGLDAEDLRARIFAHFVLEAWTAADTSGDPAAGLDIAFDLIEHGWAPIEDAAKH